MTRSRIWSAPKPGLTRRNFLATATAAGAVIAAPSYLRAQSQPFRLGVVRPLTGPLASSFAGLFASADIAVEELNSAGGLLGRQIEMFVVDDAGAPAQQPIVMRQIIQEGINVAVGPIGSSQTLASLAVSTPAKILQSGFITAVEGADGLRYPYHYQCAITVELQGQLFIEYLRNNGATNVGILVEDSDAGSGTLDKLLTALPEAGIEVTGHRIAPLRSTDMTPFLRDLRNSGAENLIVFLSNAIDVTQFFVGMNRLNWRPPVVGHNGLFFATALDAVPAEIRYREVYGATYRGLTYTDTEEPPERVKEYVAKLQRRDDIAPAALGLSASSPFYEFLTVLKRGTEETDSLDPEVLKGWLDQLQGHDGLFGTVGFTPENHASYSVDAVALAEVFPEPHPLFESTHSLFRMRG